MDLFERLMLIVIPTVTFVVVLLDHKKKPAKLGSAMLWTLGFIVVALLFNLGDERTNPQHSFSILGFFLLREATFASDILAIGYGLAAFCLYLFLFDRQKAVATREDAD